MTGQPRLATQNDLPAVLDLIQTAFAYMDGRIDPPTSMHRLTLATLLDSADRRELWVLERAGNIAATMTLTPKPHALYLGKLAVSATCRGQGLARRMVGTAGEQARATGLNQLELQTRVELTQNIAAFEHLGFAVTGHTSHAGYDRPTSVTMVRNLST